MQTHEKIFQEIKSLFSKTLKGKIQEIPRRAKDREEWCKKEIGKLYRKWEGVLFQKVHTLYEKAVQSGSREVLLACNTCFGKYYEKHRSQFLLKSLRLLASTS